MISANCVKICSQPGNGNLADMQTPNTYFWGIPPLRKSYMYEWTPGYHSLILISNSDWWPWCNAATLCDIIVSVSTRIPVEYSQLVIMLSMLLPGTNVVYYGNEIGLASVNITCGQSKDPYALAECEGLGKCHICCPPALPLSEGSHKHCV